MMGGGGLCLLRLRLRRGGECGGWMIAGIIEN